MSSSRRAPAYFFRPEAWSKVDQENDDMSNSKNSKSTSTLKKSSTSICGKGVICTGFSPSVCTKCKKNMCKGCTDRCLGCGNATMPVTTNQYFIANYTKRK